MGDSDLIGVEPLKDSFFTCLSILSFEGEMAVAVIVSGNNNNNEAIQEEDQSEDNLNNKVINKKMITRITYSFQRYPLPYPYRSSYSPYYCYSQH